MQDSTSTCANRACVYHEYNEPLRQALGRVDVNKPTIKTYITTAYACKMEVTHIYTYENAVSQTSVDYKTKSVHSVSAATCKLWVDGKKRP